MCVGGPISVHGCSLVSTVNSVVRLMRSSWKTGQCVTAYVVLNVTAESLELGGRLPFVVPVVVLRLFCGDRGRSEVNVEHSIADVGSGWADQGAAELWRGERGHFLQAPAVVWEVIQSSAVPFLASSPERDYL